MIDVVLKMLQNVLWKFIICLKQNVKKTGLAGREWAISQEAGFTAEMMGNNIIEGLTELFNTWSPRETYEFINVNEVKKPTVPHNLLY